MASGSEAESNLDCGPSSGRVHSEQVLSAEWCHVYLQSQVQKLHWHC